MVSELNNLVEDHTLHLRHFIDRFETEIERCRSNGFVCWIVPDCEVRVLKGFFHCDSLGGVKSEELGK